MREILFRGKRVDNGEWVEGYYVADTEWSKYYIYQPQHTGVYIELRAIKVRPETVGQFTGLLDKNGKKIFEGDVVMAPDYSKGLAITYKQPMKKITIEYRKGYKLTSGVDFRGVEIIGNIHDNPELI